MVLRQPGKLLLYSLDELEGGSASVSLKQKQRLPPCSSRPFDSAVLQLSVLKDEHAAVLNGCYSMAFDGSNKRLYFSATVTTNRSETLNILHY